ncbi:MAG: hypothetical protein K9G57_14840, partial [Ignavibacteriales bacterium]|nr:hypothetical protein [Ignavibacteriales bacterium]MCF8438126.1 hypothetical protein [Ignavibacteriales bacterium]
MYQNLHKYVFFALVLFAFIVKAQDRPNISYNDLLLKSENDFGLITEARLAAANFGLPFSIYTKDGYFIDAVGVENGMPVYAVITKVHDPINNGYTAFWHQISAEINLNDARMHYTDGRITNPGLGYSVSNLKSEGGMLLVMESTGKRTLGLDPYSGDLVDPEVTLSDASNLTTPIQTRTSPWGFYSISDQIKDGVMAYDTAGVFSSFFAPAGGVNNDILNNVRGHNYHPVTGNLLVTNGSAPVDDLIQEFDNMGNFIGSFITPTTGGVDSPFDIIFRASDALASGSSSNAVHRYDFDGNLLGYFVTSISFPEQISEQTDGNVAVAGFSPPSGLYVYDANGTQIKFLTGVTGLRGCFQLGNGNYIVTNGAGVHEIDSESGVLIRTVVAGVSGRYATLSGPAGTPPNVWNLTLSVLDAGGAKSDIDLQIGQHPNATDGIDSELGEIELPPVPPAGAFDARLNLPVTPPASSLIDIRNSELTEAEWTFQFQPGVSGYPFTFNWNPESLPDGSFYLTDAFGGIFVNVNMKSTNTFSLTNSAVTSLKIEFTSALESTFNTADGWNIISVPLAMADMSVATLFPAAVTSAFGFDNGYVVVDNLINGAGYWLKFSEADEHTFTGQAFVGNVSVSEGWNMVGPFNVETPVSAVISDPPGLIASSFFGFDNGYVVPENLMPGHGYWVKASGNGELIMNTPVKDGEKGVNEAAMYEIAFNVVDGVGGTYNMAAGIDPLGTDGLDAGLGEAELPPAPPAGIFDARFVFPDNVTGSLKDYRM